MTTTPHHVHVESFGAVYGPPDPGALLVLSLRTLAFNPMNEPGLKGLTGLDDAIVAHVMGTPGVAALAQAMTRAALALLAATDPGEPVRIAVGCRAGRHRSVVMAGVLAQALVGAGHAVELTHRDLGSTLAQYRAAEAREREAVSSSGTGLPGGLARR